MYYICNMNDVQEYRTPLEEAMKKNRWSDPLLAKETGLNSQTIRLYRLGIRTPRVDDAIRISQILSVPIDELFQNTEKVN